MKNFKSCLRGLAAIVRPLGWKLSLSVLLGCVRIAASMAFVWISKRLVDIVTGQVQEGAVSDLDTAVGVMAAVLLVQLASSIAAAWWNSYITVKAQNKLRFTLFHHVMKSRWSGRETFHSGDTINRLEEDIRVVMDLVCTSVPDVIVTLCQLVAASFFLFTMAPGLMWILLILMPVAIIGSRLFFRTIRRLSNRIRALDSDVQKHMQENLQQRALVLTLGATEKVIERMGLIQKDLEGNYITRMNYNAVAKSFLRIGFLGGYAAAFLWGIYGIREGSVTYGMMTAFLQLVGQVQRPIADISQHIPAFIHSLTSIERLMELQELPEEEPGEDIRFAGAPGLKVEGLGFSYPEGPYDVFKDFSFDFTPGSVTAVTGITGAGKSTLIKLLLALLEPGDGSISIYGEGKEAKVTPATRCNFMYVPQGNTLMSGTIRENLLLARPGASEEQMKEALHAAVADFVLDLPQGLDTICSEKGAGLSEGQAQRIAIARALLHEGGVLILDEASSALDAATEHTLLERISGAGAGRTIIWITHREAIAKIATQTLNI